MNNQRDLETEAALAEIARHFYNMNEEIRQLAVVQGKKGNVDLSYWIMKEHYKAYNLLRQLDRLCDNLSIS